MINLKLLRKDLNGVMQLLSSRNFKLDCERFLELESNRRALQEKTQNLQSTLNLRSKDIVLFKHQKIDEKKTLLDLAEISSNLQKDKEDLRLVLSKIEKFLSNIPNLPNEDIPKGKNSESNVEILRWGIVKKYDFEIKDHVYISSVLMGIDFKLAADMSSSRFPLMFGEVARLHRALTQFMLDTHVSEHQYKEVYVPYLVNSTALFGTGQLPKFSDDLFTVNCERPLSLIPTAEVPLLNIVRDKIINVASLPLKFVAYSPCFRKEAGSYGRISKGLIRQHQFEKVELVQIVHPDNAEDAFATLVCNAESILRKLELPYRIVELCSGDLGFSSCKTYDIEVWIPSFSSYVEVSSCSMCSDFQSRRMHIRYKSKNTKKSKFLHTLNGSGLAVGRTLAAVLENYQLKDGSITIPTVLKKYMSGIDTIRIPS